MILEIISPEKIIFTGEVESVAVPGVNGEFESNMCVREKGTFLVVNNKNCEISEINVDDLYQGRMKK